MAITILDPIREFVPVRNPVELRASGSLVVSAGAAGVRNIIFNGANLPVNGDTITFEWGDTEEPSITYTFKTTPVAEENELPAYVSGSGTDWVELVVARLRADYLLYNRLDITRFVFLTQIGILITSRTVGTAYSVDVAPTGFAFNSNTVVVAAADATTNDNYTFILQVLAEEDGVYAPLLEERFPSKEDGTTRFQDISEVLRSLLAPTLPAPDNTLPVHCTDSYCRFRVRVGEAYGSPLAVMPLIETEDRYAYLAGRSEEARIANPNWGTWIHGPANGPMHFLTTWPNTVRSQSKTVSVDQQEYLSFITRPVDVLTIICKVDLHYETGAPIVAHQLFSFVDVPRRMYMVPVGVQQAGLESIDATRRLHSYRVYLTYTNNTPRSESRWYQVSRKHHQERRQLLYWTSAGGLDTLVLHGPRVSDTEADITRIGRTTIAPTTLEDVRDSVAYLNSMSSAHEAGTAFLTEQELPVLRELVASELIVELINGRFVPVESASDSIATGEDRAGLASRMVKYRYAMRDTANGL